MRDQIFTRTNILLTIVIMICILVLVVQSARARGEVGAARRQTVECQQVVAEQHATIVGFLAVLAATGDRRDIRNGSK